jgi:uncharacterized membrane protein (UPF0127 family)
VIRGLVWAVGTLAVLLTACGQDAATLSPASTPVPTATRPSLLEPTPTLADVASVKALVVHVGAGTFIVEVADDIAERAVGLSGRESLARGSGMWFAYPGAGQRSFWMRGMRFPIDIVWIDASMKVIGITKEAPVPSPETSASDLPQYSPGGPVMYVLEINAGLAHDLGIEVGTLVELGNK